MTLSDLAALGSFASGIAVVISLVSLTIQMRQNTHAMIRAELNAAQEQNSIWRLAVAGSAELTGLWIRGLRDEALTEIEERRFGLLLHDLLFGALQTWDRQNRGMFVGGAWDRGTARFARGPWDTVAPRYGAMLVTKRGAKWWEQNKDVFPPNFVAAIDAARVRVRASEYSVANFTDPAEHRGTLTDEGVAP